MVHPFGSWPAVFGVDSHSPSRKLPSWCTGADGCASADRPISNRHVSEHDLRSRQNVLRRCACDARRTGSPRAMVELNQAMLDGVGGGGRTGVHVEFVEDVLDVGAGRPFADVEPFPDLTVRAPLAHELQDFSLTWR